MIHAILDGRTRGAVSKHAFVALRRQFISRDGLPSSFAITVARLIYPMIFSEKKSQNIPEALYEIKTFFGTLNFGFLSERRNRKEAMS